jgi:homoserine O-acetyltransferase
MYDLSFPCVRMVQWGDPTLPASRTVYIVPSFSNSSHVVRNLNDPSPGWWEGMVGPGLYIDTNRFRVISASNLGGPFGTTSPLSTDPSTGAQYRMGFPQITPADQARVHRMLLQHLGLSELHAMIGSSMGGMIALQFAALYPDYVRRLGVTACTAKTTPGTVARRRVQRRAIVADPNFAGGNYEVRA